MVCKITSTSQRGHQSVAGGTLVETLMSVGISGVLLAVLASLLMFSGRSFLAFFNYADLNNGNRLTTDTMTRDLRECNRVTLCTTNRLDIEDSDGSTITYNYAQGAGTLTRTQNTVTRTLVTGCDSLAFNLGTRNPIGGTFAVVATTDVTLAKVVNLSWNCSRTILGVKVNTESVQTARIVIRKQG